MKGGTTAFLVLVFIAPALAGCTAGEPTETLTQEQRAFLNTGIEGIVMDDELLPLRDVLVALHIGSRHARTDADGGYAFEGIPEGEHLVSVQAYGFAPLTYSVRVWEGSVAQQDFILRSVPVGEPYHRTYELGGFISCEGAVGSMPSDTTYIECGPDLANVQQDERSHAIEFGYGTRRILSEVDWEPTTPAAKKLTLGTRTPENASSAQTFGEVQGLPGIRILVGGGTINLVYPADGGLLEAYVRAAPAIDEHGFTALSLDEARHPPISAGLAVEQGFTLYTTVFYFSHGPPSFTAIPQ